MISAEGVEGCLRGKEAGIGLEAKMRDEGGGFSFHGDCYEHSCDDHLKGDPMCQMRNLFLPTTGEIRCNVCSAVVREWVVGSYVPYSRGDIVPTYHQIGWKQP